MHTLQGAITSLYHKAIAEGKRTSPARLTELGSCCVDTLSQFGLPGAGLETDLPGGGRLKTWDVTWFNSGRRRLALSVKSILRNVPGTVPNRLDDVMGEVANVQMLCGDGNDEPRRGAVRA